MKEPTPLRALRAALVLGLALAALSPASAAAQTRVLGMNVESTTLDKVERESLSSALQAKLAQYPQLAIVAPPERELTDEMIDLMCIDTDLDCLSRLGKKYEADQVFYVQVDKTKAGAQELLVRVVDTNKPAMLRDERTPVRKGDSLIALIATEVEAVYGAPPAPVVVAPPKAEPGRIIIEASIPNAEIRINGDYAGTGSATAERPAGKYAVRVHYPGYEEQILEVVIAEGETVSRTVTLVPAKAGPVGDGKDPVKKPIDDDDDGGGWIVWAIVGAVVVGGAVTAVALATGGEDDGPRAPVVFSIDGNNAWRDATVSGGRQ